MKNCKDCKTYSFPLLRCLKGYVNPKTHKQFKKVITMYAIFDGPAAVLKVCPWNNHRIAHMEAKVAN